MATVTRPQHFVVELVKRHWIAPDVIEFQCARPAGITFAPGQFIRFVIDGGERDYTMVSAPDASTLDFCLKIKPHGRFSKVVLEVPLGHIFDVSGPHGHFVYRRSPNRAVFVATGTGIAPFAAFSRCGVEKATLLQGAGSPESLIYRPVVQMGVDRYIPCITQSVESGQSKAINIFPGRVTDYLRTELSQGTYDFYLCGTRGDDPRRDGHY